MKKIKWSYKYDHWENREYSFGTMEYNKFYFEISESKPPYYTYFLLTAWDGSDRSYHRFKKLSSAKKVAELLMFG